MSEFSIRRTVIDISVAAAVGAFIGFLAPFGMDEMAAATVYGFWIAVCVAGAAIYIVCICGFMQWMETRLPSRNLRIALGSFIATIPATVILIYINQWFFGFNIDWATHIERMYPRVFMIGAVITVISVVSRDLSDKRSELAESQRYAEDLEKRLDTDPYEALNQKLPIDVRGDVLHIEAADHYLNVTTVNGKHMLLMRFKDALALLGDAPGMQVHRSWWVAKAAISSVETKQRRIFITTNEGIEIPVSRTYGASVRQA